MLNEEGEKLIYYIGYYNCPLIRNEQRNVSPAAETKMSYIISALEKATNECVTVVSPAKTRLHFLIKGCNAEISEKTTLKTFSSFCSSNKLLRAFGYAFTDLSFAVYLLKNVKREDSLIVYHSLTYMRIIKMIKAIKKCDITLEVEEVYNDVLEKSEVKRKNELRFLEIGDKYIFPTEQLNELLNKGNKPYSVVHGTYLSEEEREQSFGDGKIHVLYAGTLDPRKGGAVAAAHSAKYLSQKYHVHILGFGEASEIIRMQETVNQIQETSEAIVTYDGQLQGEDCIRFIQKCHIGLSTQNPNASFNVTSFPSKILSYMANGLRVVSARIPVVETSAIGKYMYYYDTQTPEAIAQTILNVDLTSEYNSRMMLKRLDQDFCDKLKKMI